MYTHVASYTYNFILMCVAIREGTKALRAWLATYSVYTYVHARSYTYSIG